MTFKAAVASGLVLAGAEHVKLTYKDCGSSSTHAKVTSLKPDAIDVPGKAAIIGSGTLDSDQTGAHFNLKVTKGILPFFSGKGNICEDTSFELPLGVASFTVKGLDCPVSAGNIDVEVDLDILSDLFEDGENSLLSIHIDANADDTGDQVLCLDVDASLATELPKSMPMPSAEQQSKAEEVDKTVEIEKAVEITLPWLTNSCSNKGHCGNAYQACCIGFQAKGFPCGCHLADGGSGQAIGDCGDCGAAYKVCCEGYAVTGNACTCDVSDGGVVV